MALSDNGNGTISVHELDKLLRDVKKKQNKMEKETEKVIEHICFLKKTIIPFQSTFVMYVDRDRGAGVTLGVSDLNSDLKKKRKDEKVGSLQETLDWTIFYKEGLADVARGRIEKAEGLFDKVGTCRIWIHFTNDPQINHQGY